MSETYRKDEALGAGGFATVYKGWDESLNRSVAIKEPEERFATDPAFREAFTTAARRVAAIAHANLIDIYAIKESDESPWIVMELAEGSLADLTRQGPLAPQEVTRILIQVLRGLDELHAAGVVHRNIKPTNILRVRDGWKLADFAVEAEAMPYSTPKYLSPESLGETEAVGPASDLYSLGIVAYEMLLGEQRFQELAGEMAGDPGPDGAPADLDQVWFRLHGGAAELPAPHTIDLGIPEELSGVVANMVRKDLDSRFASCEDALVNLELLAGETKRAKPKKEKSGFLASLPLWAKLLGGVGAFFFLMILLLLLIPTSAPRVTISSEPAGALVFVGDRLVGETPIEGREISAGSEVSVRKDGYLEARLVVGEEPEQAHELSLVRGVVTVGSAPAGATVSVGDEEVGETPLDVPRSAGALELTVSLEGFETQDVVVEPAEEAVEVVLRPDPLRGDRVLTGGELVAEMNRFLGGEPGVSLRLEEAAGGPSATRLAVGRAIGFEATAQEEAFLVLFSIDANGAVTCFYPNAQRSAVKLAAGVAQSLPLAEDRDAGFVLTTSPPIGRDTVFLFTSPTPPSPPAGVRGPWVTTYDFDAGGATSPAVVFARWLSEQRRKRLDETSLVAIGFDVVAGP